MACAKIVAKFGRRMVEITGRVLDEKPTSPVSALKLTSRIGHGKVGFTVNLLPRALGCALFSRTPCHRL
jgi:hypothetical protein